MSVMQAAARTAGTVLRDAYGGRLDVREKSPADYVTRVDVESERILLGALGAAFPGFALLGEESGETAGEGGWQWIVDPLDGTRNLVRGIPLYSLTIGLARDGDPVAGLVYDPLRDEMFSGMEGRGADLNGAPISVAGARRLEDCVIGLDLGKSAGVYRESYALLGRLMPRFQSIRLIGSMALGMAYVAAGRLDAYFNLKASPWDVAGGIAIARLAGASVTDLAGASASIPTGGLIAANPEIARQFVEATT